MIGVSPSFFFSKYTTDFTVEDYIDGLTFLKEMGIDAFQGEIYKKENISDWEENSHKLAKRYKELNLNMSLFVAHFFINYTLNFDSLFDDSYLSEIKRVCDIVKDNFEEVDTIVIPFGKYQVKDYKKENYQLIRTRLIELIKNITDILNAYDFKLALEIIPGSIIGGVDGLVRLIEETNADNLGYNFDTGHAYCSGEVLTFVPSKLKGKIFGTHLKDNFGDVNLSLVMGKGNINWEELCNSLKYFGYNRSLDLEISSNCENVIRDYSIAVDYLKKRNIGI